MIKFACPGCAASFTVADEKAGNKGKCPKCQTQFTIPAAAEAAAPPPTKTADAGGEPVEIKPCPKCGERLSVMGSDIGLDIECPKCATVFKAAKVGGTAATKKLAEDADDDRPSKKRRDDDEDDDRPAKKKSARRDDDEDDDDRPAKKKASKRDEEDDEDDRPSKKKTSKRDAEDDEDERPSKAKSKRGRDEDEEDDEKPAKSKSKRLVDDDEEEERPSKRGSKRDRDEEEDEDDDRPRRSKGGKGGAVESKRMTCALLAFFIGWTGIHKFMLGHTTAGIVYILTCGLCGWGSLIDAIIYFTKSDKDFIRIYQKGGKQWF